MVRFANAADTDLEVQSHLPRGAGPGCPNPGARPGDAPRQADRQDRPPSPKPRGKLARWNERLGQDPRRYRRAGVRAIRLGSPPLGAFPSRHPRLALGQQRARATSAIRQAPTGDRVRAPTALTDQPLGGLPARRKRPHHALAHLRPPGFGMPPDPSGRLLSPSRSRPRAASYGWTTRIRRTALSWRRPGCSDCASSLPTPGFFAAPTWRPSGASEAGLAGRPYRGLNPGNDGPRARSNARPTRFGSE